MKKKKQQPLLETLKRIGGKINEEPIRERDWRSEDYPPGESPDDWLPFTTSDGWDEDQLEDIGLMELFADIQKVIYEVKNARRGSYARFGDTPQDLADELIRLGNLLDAAGEGIINQLRD